MDWHWDSLRSTDTIEGVWHREIGTFESWKLDRHNALKVVRTRQDVMVTRKVI